MKEIKLIDFIEIANSLVRPQGMLRIKAKTPDFISFPCHSIQFGADHKEVQFRLTYGIETYCATMEVECMTNIYPIR